MIGKENPCLLFFYNLFQYDKSTCHGIVIRTIFDSYNARQNARKQISFHLLEKYFNWGNKDVIGLFKLQLQLLVENNYYKSL